MRKNYEIERACLELEFDTSKLRQQIDTLKPKTDAQYGEMHGDSNHGNDVDMEESEEEEEEEEDEEYEEEYAASR